MTLSRDFDVLHAAAGLGNFQAVGAHAFEVELDCFVNFALNLFYGIAHGDTARKIRNVRRVISFTLFDHDCVAHGDYYG